MGANYLLDGLRMAAELFRGEAWADGYLNSVVRSSAIRIPLFFDSVPLLLFALATWRGRLSPGLALVAAAPGLLVGAACVAFLPSSFSAIRTPLWLAYLAVFTASYLAALALLARRYVAAEAPAERDRLAALLVGFGVIVLPRIPLLVMDLGVRIVVAPPPSFPPRPILEAAVMATLFALYARFVLRRAGPDARPHAERTVRSLGWMLVLVGLGWALYEFLRQGIALSFGLLYSGRWFAFAAFLVAGGEAGRFVDLPERTTARLRRFLAVLLAAIVLVELAAIVDALPAVPLGVALLDGVAIAGFGLAAYAVFRLAVARPSVEVGWQRVQAYRAQLALGASDDELESLRARLGLSVADARELRRLAEVDRALAAATPLLAQGALLAGRYEVGPVAGAGAFGLVHEATDRATGARVVLKELGPRWRADDEAVRRFRREAETALRVDHPNLVRFHALERTAHGHVLVLGRVEGETLAERLARGTLPPAAAVRVAQDVLAGLAELHRVGIVHRDVKPANVMLRPDGRAVLLDFGCATPRADGGTRPAGAPSPGTPEYMSPEQARGEAVAPASDLYAVGLVLRESLAGDVPPELGGLLDRALHPDPHRRWPSAEAFREALFLPARVSPTAAPSSPARAGD